MARTQAIKRMSILVLFAILTLQYAEDDEQEHNKAKRGKTYANIDEIVGHKVMLHNTVGGIKDVFLRNASVAAHAKPNERIRSDDQYKKNYEPRRQVGTSSKCVDCIHGNSFVRFAE